MNFHGILFRSHADLHFQVSETTNGFIYRVPEVGKALQDHRAQPVTNPHLPNQTRPPNHIQSDDPKTTLKALVRGGTQEFRSSGIQELRIHSPAAPEK